MSHRLYKITNKNNGKIYIGQTEKTVDERFAEHLRNSRYGVQQRLNHAIRKHGEDAFYCESIGECETQEETDETETRLIAEHDARNPEVGYNDAVGGT